MSTLHEFLVNSKFRRTRNLPVSWKNPAPEETQGRKLLTDNNLQDQPEPDGETGEPTDLPGGVSVERDVRAGAA